MVFIDSLMTGLSQFGCQDNCQVGLQYIVTCNAALPCIHLHTPFFMTEHGAKHSYPGGKFQKSEGPTAAVVETTSHKVSYGQIVPKWRNLDSNPNDFRLRFQLCPPQVLNATTYAETQPRFCENLEIFMKSDFLKSSYMKSRGVKYHS